MGKHIAIRRRLSVRKIVLLSPSLDRYIQRTIQRRPAVCSYAQFVREALLEKVERERTTPSPESHHARRSEPASEPASP